MRGYFIRTKDGYIGMIKDTFSIKEYKKDELVGEKTMIYLFDDIKGQNTFSVDEVDIFENLFHI